MSMRRKFTNEQMDAAEEMRASGEKWAVINLILGENIDQACRYRKAGRYANQFNEDAERRQFETRDDVPRSRLAWCSLMREYFDSEIDTEWRGWKRCAMARCSA